MPNPVSWLVVERGWSVLAADGTEIGNVDETVGDSGRDIFSGIALAHGLLGKPRFLPAERVTSIEEGRILTDLRAGEADELEPHDSQPSLQIRPE